MTSKISTFQKAFFFTLLSLMCLLLSSCGLGEAVEGIFKFGFWAGALLVIVVLTILGFIIYKIFKK